jgi:hypothetical protein
LKETCSTILCLRTFSLSMVLTATGPPVWVSRANLTFANVPSPMVRPSSYFPTRLFTLVVLIPRLTPSGISEASPRGRVVSLSSVERSKVGSLQLIMHSVHNSSQGKDERLNQWDCSSTQDKKKLAFPPWHGPSLGSGRNICRSATWGPSKKHLNIQRRQRI